MRVFILGIFKETGHHSRGASHAPLLALEILDFSCQFTPTATALRSRRPPRNSADGSPEILPDKKALQKTDW